MRSEVSSSELDYFIRCVLTILLGVVCYASSLVAPPYRGEGV
jgi:hypothetical protein